MSGVEVRPFRRSDRHQVTDLVNAHVQAVVPGVSVSVNAVLSQLEREPGEFVVDPWVVERVTLVGEQRGRVAAAAHLLRYGSGPQVGPALRGAAEIRWLLCAPDAPFWPDASAAGLAVAEAAVGTLRGWRPARIGADGTLPAPGVYGVPEQWPHVAGLLGRVGFTRGERTEIVLLADVAALPRPAPPTGLRVVRTLGTVGTRLAAVRDDCVVGFRRGRHRHRRVRSDRRPSWLGRRRQPVGAGGRPAPRDRVMAARRGRGVAAARAGRPAAGLRRSRRHRRAGFLERSGFRRLTETARDWDLPVS